MRRRAEATRPGKDADPQVFLPLPHLPFHVLLALAEGPLHGWDVVKRIREISGGRDNPNSGSLYLALARLEERFLVERAESPPGADGRRRYMQLTALGRRVLSAETERLAGLVELARGASGDGRDPTGSTGA